MAACAHCSATENLEVHHRTPRCGGGSDEDTEILCRECHTRHHVENGDFARWLQERIQKLFAELGPEGARSVLQEWGRHGGQVTLERYGREHLQRIAPAGGKACVAKHGAEHMAEIGRRGAQKRWHSEQAQKEKEEEYLPF